MLENSINEITKDNPNRWFLVYDNDSGEGAFILFGYVGDINVNQLSTGQPNILAFFLEDELETYLDNIAGLGCAAGGAFAFWFKIKGSVSLLCQRVKSLEDSNLIVHKRLDSLKDEVKENRDKSDNAIADITGKMQAMELRIITAIHELKI